MAKKERYFFTMESGEMEVASIEDLRKLWEEYEEDKESYPFHCWLECVQSYNNGAYEEVTNKKLSSALAWYRAVGKPCKVYRINGGDSPLTEEEEKKALLCYMEDDMDDNWNDCISIWAYVPQEVEA